MRTGKIFRKKPSLNLLKKDSGIILVASLWIVVIFSVLAIGIGRQASLELKLAKHSLGAAKAFSYAWGGLSYVIRQIHLDSKDEESGDFDSLKFCGLTNRADGSTQDLFKDVEMDGGLFNVSYEYQEDEVLNQTVYGLSDEERKININGIKLTDVGVLSSLISLLGVDDNTSWEIAYSVVDWTDRDADKSDDIYGAENEYYLSLDPPYRSKNTYFDSLEELLLVRGMTQEIFAKIKPYVTVFPKSDELNINFETASPIVLRAVANSLAGPQTNTELEDAQSLVDKMIEFRRGEDAVSFSDDDQLIEMNDMALNANEKVIYLVMTKYKTAVSDYLRARIVGEEKDSKAQARIDVVIHRQDLSIVYWNRK